jgi:chromosome segregation ATPase
LRTLELRNSQLDEVQIKRDILQIDIASVTEDRDQLRETHTRTNERLQSTQITLRNLELDHASILSTLELRNSLLDEVQTQRDNLETQLTATTEDRDRLQMTFTHTNKRLQRAQVMLQNLGNEHAATLRTLQLHNSKLDELVTRHETEITDITEDRDWVRGTLTQTNRRLHRAQTELRNLELDHADTLHTLELDQALLRNLRANFPNNAEALLSTRYQIEGIVFRKDGCPDLRYKAGRSFRRVKREESSVLHDGRRTFLILTAVSE